MCARACACACACANVKRRTCVRSASYAVRGVPSCVPCRLCCQHVDSAPPTAAARDPHHTPTGRHPHQLCLQHMAAHTLLCAHTHALWRVLTPPLPPANHTPRSCVSSTWSTTSAPRAPSSRTTLSTGPPRPTQTCLCAGTPSGREVRAALRACCVRAACVLRACCVCVCVCVRAGACVCVCVCALRRVCVWASRGVAHTTRVCHRAGRATAHSRHTQRRRSLTPRRTAPGKPSAPMLAKVRTRKPAPPGGCGDAWVVAPVPRCRDCLLLPGRSKRLASWRAEIAAAAAGATHRCRRR
jgi:hypothetical protein